MSKSTVSSFFASYVVLSASGAVDVAATTAKFAADLDAFKSEKETGGERLLTAINAVFDAHKGTPISTEFVINDALRVLGATEDPIIYAATKKQLTAFIQANHQGKKLDDGSWERPNSLFISNKGRAEGGGTLGLQRRADLKLVC